MQDEQTQGKGPAEQRPRKAQAPQPAGAMSPGDEAPAGTPGAGEQICEVCGGKGKVEGKACRNCSGTGIIIQAIGGA